MSYSVFFSSLVLMVAAGLPPMFVAAVCGGEELAATGSSDTSPDLPRPSVKCGRDVAFVCLRKFGRPLALEEVDGRLKRADVVSFADLRVLFESLGLVCSSQNFSSGEYDRVQSLCRAHHGEVMCIVALPTLESQTTRHFSLLESITNDAIEFVDATGSDRVTVRRSDLARSSGVPILLVGTSRAAVGLAPSSVSDLGRWIAKWFGEWPLFVAMVAALLASLAFSHRSALLVGLARGGRYVRGHRFASCCLVGSIAMSAWIYQESSHGVAFDRTEVDLRVVPVGVKQTVELRLTNHRRQSVRLREFRMSCSCLEAVAGTSVLGPGESTRVTVSLEPKVEGHTEQFVDVFLDENGTASSTARIKSFAVVGAHLSPHSTNIGVLPQGISYDHELKLEVVGYDGPPIPLELKVAATEPPFTAEIIGDGRLAAGGTVRVKVRASAERPKGAFTLPLTFRTREPLPREFVAQVIGEVVDAIQVSPEAVALRPGTSTTLCIRTEFELPVEIGDIEPPSKAIDVRPTNAAGDGGQREVSLILSVSNELAPLPNLDRASVLRVHLKKPVSREIQVPICVFPKSG